MEPTSKADLILMFANGLAATGEKFEALITSLKGLQASVDDPSPSGNNKSITFISNISQNAEGVITAIKKTVNFSGYQTTSAMGDYQQMDLQQVGVVTASAGSSQSINHNMKHYPTVRLMDDTGVEVMPSEYKVTHADAMTLDIKLGDSLTGNYKYILD